VALNESGLHIVPQELEQAMANPNAELFTKIYVGAGSNATSTDIILSPTGGDDTSTIQAALTTAKATSSVTPGYGTNGKRVLLNGGLFQVSAEIIVPDLVDLLGAGMRATVLKMTAAGGRLTYGPTATTTPSWATITGGVTGRGGSSGDFFIDANNTATTPFYIGLATQRLFRSIEVRNGSGSTNAGMTVAAAQNCTFLNVNCEANAGTNLRVDMGAGGNRWYGCEANAAGKYNLEIIQSGTSPASLYTVPSDNHFTSCIFERAGTAGTANLYLGGGGSTFFDGCNFENASATSNFPAVKIRLDHASGVGPYHFTNCAIQGTQANTVGYDITGALTVHWNGTNFLFLQKDGIKADDTCFLTNSGFLRNANVTNAFTNQGGGTGTIESRIQMPLVSGAKVANLETFRYHTATPEGAITAPVGAICTDVTNGELYVKKTGTGNTGWKQITHA